MAEFGNGLAEESLLDSDPGHPELEDPGVGDEEPGLEEGEAAIEDPVSEGHCLSHMNTGRHFGHIGVLGEGSSNRFVKIFTHNKKIFGSHAVCVTILTAIVVHAVQ